MSGFQPAALLNALVYAVLGIVVFAVSFSLWDRLTPYDLWKQIIEEKNVALAIVVGFFSLGLSIIIASAVH
jgi:putative membrane protein